MANVLEKKISLLASQLETLEAQSTDLYSDDLITLRIKLRELEMEDNLNRIDEKEKAAKEAAKEIDSATKLIKEETLNIKKVAEIIKAVANAIRLLEIAIKVARLGA